MRMGQSSKKGNHFSLSYLTRILTLEGEAEIEIAVDNKKDKSKNTLQAGKVELGKNKKISFILSGDSVKNVEIKRAD